MSRSRLLSVTSMVSKTGILCLPLFQLVLSDSPCEENEMLNSSQNSIREMGRRCTNYKDQYTNGWYIWFLLLIFLVALLCGAVLSCLQCWLRKLQNGPRRCTMAVFAVGDLDPVYGTEAAVNPTGIGMHLQTQNPELYHVPCFGALGPPPPYEKNSKIKLILDLDD
ncbi:transmembrane protein 207 isoform X1 [Neophocaena asiaeorientalis asiaeorientalis]|uniref:Transmembrane protein 207 isoform X1 n=1 Tax=Neophocaena asiaeorientalis asiaeorientalis TaxID=1706337 RepID=A0A341B2K2_NEOAA|nr:transmembrane protein 207 isoform X1 [Neophocaena asiaeorientalis asiaeorientalis]